MTKAVLFDLIKTLIYREKEANTEELCRILRYHNYRIYSQQFESARRFAFFIEYPKGVIRDEESFYKLVFQLLGYAVDDQILSTTINFFHENEIFEIFEDVEPCLKELSLQPYKTAIITSTPLFIFERVLKEKLIFNYIDAIITPFEAGVVKPDPHIYLTGTEYLSVTPEESVYVTDNIQLDGSPLKELGIKYILINRESKAEKVESACTVVSSLEQIPALLKYYK